MSVDLSITAAKLAIAIATWLVFWATDTVHAQVKTEFPDLKSGRSVPDQARPKASLSPAADRNFQDGTAEFKVGKEGRLLLLPVKVGNRGLSMLLDTGASISGFDLKLRDQLTKSDRSVVISTPSGIARVEGYNWPDAMLGKLSIRSDRQVICIDFSKHCEVSGEQIDGILGMDVLGKTCVQIDFDEGRVRLSKQLQDQNETLGTKLPLRFLEDGTPLIDGLCAGQHESFLIDTGAQGCGLRSALFDSLVEKNLLRAGTSFTSVTALGTFQGRAGKIRELTLGPNIHRGLRVDRIKASALGLRYLSRYRVTFDFPHQELYFRKGARYSVPEPSATSGMTLSKIGGKLIVNSVIKDGAADHAGIKPGDIILQADGQPVATQDFFTLRQQFTTEVGKKFGIQVQRDSQKFNLPLVLQQN